jgi:hypothetical protein
LQCQSRTVSFVRIAACATQVMFSGFLLNADDIPVYFRWWEAFSFFKYAFHSCMWAVWHGDVPICSTDELVPVHLGGPGCKFADGDAVLKLYVGHSPPPLLPAFAVPREACAALVEYAPVVSSSSRAWCALRLCCAVVSVQLRYRREGGPVRGVLDHPDCWLPFRGPSVPPEECRADEGKAAVSLGPGVPLLWRVCGCVCLCLFFVCAYSRCARFCMRARGIGRPGSPLVWLCGRGPQTAPMSEMQSITAHQLRTHSAPAAVSLATAASANSIRDAGSPHACHSCHTAPAGRGIGLGVHVYAHTNRIFCSTAPSPALCRIQTPRRTARR